MKLNARKMIFIILVMLSIAFFDNVRGVFIKTFIAVFDSNYQTMGLLMFASSMAYMIGSLLAGQIASVISKVKLSRIACFAMAVAISLVAFSSSLEQLFIGFIIMSFGAATITLLINITIPNLDINNHAWMMNFVHFIYGIGATIAVKGSGYLLGQGWNFRSIYYIITVLTLIVFILSLFVTLPETDKPEGRVARFDRIDARFLIAFSIGLGFYATAEMQTGIWLMSYMKDTFALAEENASSYLALFFLLFSLGRLFGGFIAHKIGYLKSVSLSLFIAFLLYSIGLLLGLQGIYLIAVSGIFFSICYPTSVLALKDFFPRAMSRASGIVIFSASGVNMMLSYVMGYIAEHYSSATAIWIIPLSLFLSFSIILAIQLKSNKKFGTNH